MRHGVLASNIKVLALIQKPKKEQKNQDVRWKNGISVQRVTRAQ